MKVYKVTLMVIDFDNVGRECIKLELERAGYSNHCIAPEVMDTESRDIGEWHDGHILNQIDKYEAEFQRLFEEKHV